MNIDNLTPFNTETARIAAAKSHEARRRNKSFKDLANILLDQKSEDSDFTNRELIVRNAVDSAKQGNASSRKWLDNLTREKEKNFNPERKKLKEAILYAGLPQKFLPEHLLPSEENCRFLNNIADRVFSDEQTVQGRIDTEIAEYDFSDYQPTPPKYDFEAENMRHKILDKSISPIPAPEPFKLPPFYYDKDSFSLSSVQTKQEDICTVTLSTSKNKNYALTSTLSLSSAYCSISKNKTRQAQNTESDLFCPSSYEPTDKILNAFYSGSVKDSPSKISPEKKQNRTNLITDTREQQPPQLPPARDKRYTYITGAGWVIPLDPHAESTFRETVPPRQHPAALFPSFETQPPLHFDIKEQSDKRSSARENLTDENDRNKAENNACLALEEKISSRYSHAKRENPAPIALAARIPLHAVHVSYIVNSPEDIENKERRKAARNTAESIVDTLYASLHAPLSEDCPLTIIDLLARNYTLNLLESSPKYFEKSLKLLKELEEDYEQRHPIHKKDRYYWLDHNGVRLYFDEGFDPKNKIRKTGIIQQLINFRDEDDEL